MEELTFAELLTKISTYIVIAFTAVISIMGLMVYRGLHLTSSLITFLFLGAFLSVLVLY
ncbi:MAG: hypothetical protein QXJ68_05660 [Methanocellales archaeon]